MSKVFIYFVYINTVEYNVYRFTPAKDLNNTTTAEYNKYKNIYILKSLDVFFSFLVCEMKV